MAKTKSRKLLLLRDRRGMPMPAREAVEGARSRVDDVERPRALLQNVDRVALLPGSSCARVLQLR